MRESASRTAAIQSLAVDAITAEVVTALQAAGLNPLLLKGPVHARWLYNAATERPYFDTDLLVDPRAFRRATDVLERLGFRRWIRVEEMPRHRETWIRAERAVDLHRALPYTTAPPQLSWRLLSSQPGTITVGGRSVSTLGLTARRLHVAIHAAQHGGAYFSHMDLQLALERSEPRDWHEVVRLAIDIGAVDALSAGLRTQQLGSTLCAALGLAYPQDVEILLLAGGGAPVAVSLAQLSGLSKRARLRFLWRKAFPSLEYLRARRDALGQTASLRTVYFKRVCSIIRHAPLGWSTWRTAREASLAADTSVLPASPTDRAAGMVDEASVSASGSSGRATSGPPCAKVM